MEEQLVQEEVCVDILSEDCDVDADDLKRKASSAKKPPRPQTTNRAFSLDAADQKLLRELALIKRARLERMKALLLQKKSPSSSPNPTTSNFFAMIFTLLVFVVLLFQGMSCQISCGTFQGSPPPNEPNEKAFIFMHHQSSSAAHDSV